MKFENVIICDQVRREESGKHLLIGVYPHNILFPSFPGTIVLSVWIQMLNEKGGNIPVEIRVKDSNDKILTSGGATIQAISHGGLVTLTIPSIPIDISNETVLSFQIREPKKHWKTLKKMPVALSPKLN